MNAQGEMAGVQAEVAASGRILPGAARELLRREFKHLRSNWWWFLLLGLLLSVCGTAAVILPALTVTTTFAAVLVLGVSLMIAGIATIVGAFWAGKWSGFLLQVLCGILYVVSGFVITDAPGEAAMAVTMILASFFIMLGAFRIVAALVIQFPQWGWALLNGSLTLLIGVVIYRHFPQSALWVIGLLVGLEMLMHGWTWIMLSLAIRSIPEEAA